MTTLAVPVLFADFDGNFESKLFSDLAGFDVGAGGSQESNGPCEDGEEQH